MDELQHTREGFALPLQGPHWHHQAGTEPLAEFAPLRLVLQPGGLAVEVGKPSFLVGRHSEVDMRLPLPEVSRRHCRILYADRCWKIVDLNSLNGIFVNGERVQEAVLHQHDQITIGSATFQVDLHPKQQTGGAAPAPSKDAEGERRRLAS